MQETTEQWLPVVGYEGLYEVSNMGRVKRVKAGQGARVGGFLSLRHKHRFGYTRVALCSDGKAKTYYVHALVAKAFISNPLNHKTVNHIDNDPSNNNASNLEWVSSHKNTLHASNQSRMKTGGRIKVQEATRELIKKDYEDMKTKSMRILSEKYKICLRTVWLICNDKPRSNPNYWATADYIEPTADFLQNAMVDRANGLTQIEIARKYKVPYSYVSGRIK